MRFEDVTFLNIDALIDKKVFWEEVLKKYLFLCILPL